MGKKKSKKPAKVADELTLKQRRFVEAYQGNGVEAAESAGYAGNANVLGVAAFHLLRNPKIRAAIQSREDVHLSELVAGREERQVFWAEAMRNPFVEMKDRLKASELLGKSEADFTEKVKHEGTVGITVLDPYASKPEPSDG